MAAKPVDPGSASFRPRVDRSTFFGVLWGGTALSLCFLIIRILVRIKYFKKVYPDDLLVTFAWILLLTNAIIWQTQKNPMYNQYPLSAGLLEPTPHIIAAEIIMLRTEVATFFLFYTCLWSVKISVLVFFRRLGQKLRGQRIWWWCVLGVTIATWATCIGDIQYPCLLRALEYIETVCSGQGADHFQWVTLHYNCAVDVITDAMIITIPVLMLWRVRISWRKKLALIGLFSLTVIVIVFSIVRVAVATTHKTQADIAWDITWLYMWSSIEMAVSIIVACLASFRQLFVKSEQSARDKQSGSSSSWMRSLLSSLRTVRLRSASGNKGVFSSNYMSRHRNLPSGQNSEERIVPLDTITITRDVDMSSDSFRADIHMPKATVQNSCYPNTPSRS